MYVAKEKANNDAFNIFSLFLLSSNPSISHAKIAASNKRLISNNIPPNTSNNVLKTIIIMLESTRRYNSEFWNLLCIILKQRQIYVHGS